MNFFDPGYYEYQALMYISGLYESTISINTRLPMFSTPLKERPEIDGLIEFEGKEWVVEVKSYQITIAYEIELISRFNSFGINRIILVAPEFEDSRELINIKKIKFTPNTNLISDFYKKWSPLTLPSLLQTEFLTGWHHFKYKMSKRSKNKNELFLNQIDKRIKNYTDLKTEITERLRIDKNPPIRVYWSVKKWLSPKDLYYKNVNPVYLGGMIVFDIDGPAIHGSFSPCRITSEGICEDCMIYSTQHAKRLVEYLTKENLGEINVFFSGRQGFHVYVSPNKEVANGELNKILMDLRSKKIKVDSKVTTNIKSVIGFPGTLHGYTLKVLEHVVMDNKFNYREIL